MTTVGRHLELILGAHTTGGVAESIRVGVACASADRERAFQAYLDSGAGADAEAFARSRAAHRRMLGVEELHRQLERMHDASALDCERCKFADELIWRARGLVCDHCGASGPTLEEVMWWPHHQPMRWRCGGGGHD